MPTDPNFSNVSLLAHLDASPPTDAAGIATLSLVGSAAISTANPKFGAGCLLLDGTDGNYLKATGLTTVPTGGDYTIELWQRLNATGGNVLDFRPSNGPVVFTDSGSTALGVYTGPSGVYSSGGTLKTDGTYQHIALARSSGTVTLYVDGVAACSGTDTTNGLGAIAYFGTGNGGGGTINGRQDEIRYTPGVARYTTNFTPPTAVFPDSGSGGGAITGSLAATETADTFAASGSATSTVVGSMAAAEGRDVFGATGSVGVSGTMGTTESADAFAATSGNVITGTMSAAETADTFTSTGAVSVIGTMAAAETRDAFTALGPAAIQGALAAQEADDTFSANGTVTQPITGAMASTETRDAFAGSIAITAGNVLAITEAPDVFSATGTITVAGSIVAIETSDRFSALVAVVNPYVPARLAPITVGTDATLTRVAAPTGGAMLPFNPAPGL